MPHMSKPINETWKIFAFLSFSHPCCRNQYIECTIVGTPVNRYAHLGVSVGYHALVAILHQGIRIPCPKCQNRLTRSGKYLIFLASHTHVVKTGILKALFWAH